MTKRSERIAASLSGRRLSDSHRRNIAASLAGKPKSAQHRKRIAASLTGRQLTRNHRAKISASVRGEATVGGRISDAELYRIQMQIGGSRYEH